MIEDLVLQVGEILHGYNMWPDGTHLGVAVSGGADSVVLLHIVHSWNKGGSRELTVLHVNHQLRGIESDEDEHFVKRLAATLGLPFLCGIAPVGTGNLEQEARLGRQLFFQSCREQAGIDRIALGHTQSDQAETVLFRLLRGSGLAGLAGMSPTTRSGLVRPLLFTSRKQVRDYALAEKLEWREDSSNQELTFRRNRLRRVTMPQFASDFNPNLESTLARIATLAQSEEAFWERRIARLHRRLFRSGPLGGTVPVAALRALDLAEQRRLLRRCVKSVKGDLRSINLSHIEAILQICRSRHGHDRVMVPGVDAIRSFETLLLTHPGTLAEQPRRYQVEIALSQRTELPFHAGNLIITAVNTTHENCVTVNNTSKIPVEDVYFDRDAMRGPSPTESFLIRNWEPGDQFQRERSSRPEKVKSLFQEKRIVLWERRHWPVLVVSGEIAWVRGFGAGSRFCPTVGTSSLLSLRFEQAQ